MQRSNKFPPLNTFVGGFLYINRLQWSVISPTYLGYRLSICIFSFNCRFGIITLARVFGSDEFFLLLIWFDLVENNKVHLLQ